MKMKKYLGFIGVSALLLTGCNDFLDREPLDKIIPEIYFNTEADLAAYSIQQYEKDGGSIFPTLSANYGMSVFGIDNSTDNQASSIGGRDEQNLQKWYPGLWKVGSVGGEWDFSKIRSCNYFLEEVLPRYEAGKITGNIENIKHYIGEIYFIRAYLHFTKLQKLGDFPYLDKTYKDQKEELIEASKRLPRNLLARNILEDLDRAAALLLESSPNGKQRITRGLALLIKSNVALFEGTWLKYHKGTAHVPGGSGWPGAGKDYLKGFTIDIDAEIDFFLTEAMKAALPVADKMVGSLTRNTGIRLGTSMDGKDNNPYFTMFSKENMEDIPEVMFWRAFKVGEYSHNVQSYLQRNHGGTGYTKGFVETFLMKNGLPIYASGANYQGDETLVDVFTDRDTRLTLFTKLNGDTVYYYNGAPVLSPAPKILEAPETRSATGYPLKKGLHYDGTQQDNDKGYSGSCVYRGAEALLNYMEANYELNGRLDGNSDKYWRALRTRAGVDADYTKTIANTNMSKEALGDFGAYSKGALIDPTLYNIRRERRCEFIAEGHRYDDLRRWRAMDQLIGNYYQIEGFKLWGEMQQWYEADELIQGGGKATVSSSSLSLYLRPYQITEKESNSFYNGYSWNAAHYLNPIAMTHFRQTSLTGELDDSVIYQNPGWSKVGGEDLKP